MTQLPHSLRVLHVLLSHEPHGTRRRSRAPPLLTAALVALLAALLLSLGPPPEAPATKRRRRPTSPAAGARELLGPFDGWTHARAVVTIAAVTLRTLLLALLLALLVSGK